MAPAIVKKPGKQATLGKFFSTPAGYKPPAEPKSTKKKDKEDVEMTDAKDDENGETVAEDVRSKEEVTDTNGKSSAEPAKKKRRVVKDDSDEDEVASATIPSPPIPKSSPKASRKTPSPKPLKKSKTPPAKPLEDAVASDTESHSSSEELDLDPKTTKKSAEKLLDWTPSKTSWAPGTPVPYSALCATFDTISSTTKRLEILSHLTKFYRTVVEITPENLLQTVYLTINRIAPDYEGLELGIGESLLVKAIAESSGRSLQQVKNELEKTGDLGDIAQKSKGAQPTMFKPSPLTVPGVFKSLKEIATTSGQSSQGKKIAIIKKLLASCSSSKDPTQDHSNEAKYLIRSLEGKLRIHLAEKTVLVALAHAAVHSQPPKPNSTSKQVKVDPSDLARAEEVVKAVFSELPSYDIVVPASLQGGWRGLRERCKLTPGVPLKPMLAKPTKSIGEVLDRFEGREFTCEYKYDGERAQIHFIPPKEGGKGGGETKVYSRNSEDMSKRYPDIVEQLPRIIRLEGRGKGGFVLDCECVAWDAKEERLLPFQVLSTRKRKDVQLSEVTVKVILFGFDILYLDGESLLQHSFKERRQLLRDNFTEVKGEFAFAKNMDATSIEEIQTFLEEAVKDSCEGLMVKMLSGEGSSYEPSKRSMNWLKIKKDYLAGVGDSLDLVVVGAFHGRGKRTNVYGAYLLACYDPSSQEYQTICKIGTGFSDEILESHTTALKPHIISAKKSYYAHPQGGEQPGVWFEPKFVWEVLCADLSLSPRYQAALGECAPGKGISLRFPRFIRVREDKSPEDATTSEQVAEFYRAQMNQQNAASTGKGAKGPQGDGRYADDEFDY